MNHLPVWYHIARKPPPPLAVHLKYSTFSGWVEYMNEHSRSHDQSYQVTCWQTSDTIQKPQGPPFCLYSNKSHRRMVQFVDVVFIITPLPLLLVTSRIYIVCTALTWFCCQDVSITGYLDWVRVLTLALGPQNVLSVILYHCIPPPQHFHCSHILVGTSTELILCKSNILMIDWLSIT